MSATTLLLVVLAVVLWPPARAATLPTRRRPPDGVAAEPTATAVTVEEVADATTLLALALRSGRGLAQALDDVATVSPDGPRADLVRVATALRWGRSMSDAWGYARPVWGPTATAFVVAEEVGAPSASVLLEAGHGLREAESRRLEEAGGRAAVLLVVPLGLCFLPAFICTAVVPLVAVLVGRGLG